MRWAKATILFGAAILLGGCGSNPGLPVTSDPSSPYTLGQVAEIAPGSDTNDRAIIYRLHDRKSGKVYLFLFHDGIGSESMVKLDEWTEGEATQEVRP